jgi:hypothetical protein
MSTDWLSEAMPVLRSVYDLQREKPAFQLAQGVETRELLNRLDFDEEAATRALIELKRADYLSGFENDSTVAPTFVRLEERAYRLSRTAGGAGPRKL